MLLKICILGRDETCEPIWLTGAGETPLGLAAGGGQVEVARLLLKWGADVHLAGPSKPQPLHRVAATGAQLGSQ